MCSTYCVSMFLCLLYAPSHQKKFQVGVNLLGNKSNSDSDSEVSDIFLMGMTNKLIIYFVFEKYANFSLVVPDVPDVISELPHQILGYKVYL